MMIVINTLSWAMIRRVVEHFQFLGNRTELEQVLSEDSTPRRTG